MIDFEIPAEVADFAERTKDFVRDVVIPTEPRELTEQLRLELQQSARDANVFAPHVPREFGGHGLDIRAWSVVFEEAGYSLLGPLALNCAAPDEGNMRLLEVVATDAQKEKYLRPLAAGQVRSCFAMSEPPPGAGSDPSLLATRAEQIDGGWRINGQKKFITGAEGAAFAICMARTGQELKGAEGATMFFVSADNPGMRIDRLIETSDGLAIGGHAEVSFTDCEVSDDAVLGEVGLGFRYAQVRLGPARLTHCMRWLGIARRALDIALDYAAEREAFGARLDELGMTQQLVADSVIDLETSRSLIRYVAWMLDIGQHGRHESSIAKVHVAEAVNRIVDRAIQICGGHGVSEDEKLIRYLNEVRPFRIYDGPSETHRWAIARRAARRRAAEREA